MKTLNLLKKSKTVYIIFYIFLFMYIMRKPKEINTNLTTQEIEDMQLLIYEQCQKYKGQVSNMLRQNGLTNEDLKGEIYMFLMHFYPVQE